VGIRDISSNDLARLCAVQGGAEEWDEFVRRFSRPISLSVIRIGRFWGGTCPSVIADIVQDIFLKFCEENRKILREFEPRHPDSFTGFLKVVSAAAANDHFRKQNTTKRGGGVREEPISEFHADTVQDSDLLERNHLLQEIDDFLAALGQDENAKRDRAVFWLYYQRGMTASAIASLPGMSISVKGVESALRRMVLLVKAHIGKPLTIPARKNVKSPEGFTAQKTVQRGEWL
jgi:RNA polymerase sigma-70 factor, ECF subfamily